MCGRFEIHSAIEIIAKLFGIVEWDIDYKPSYNVAPSHDIIIAVEKGQRQLIKSRWGFLPSWAKDISDGYKMINARAETVAEKPSFKQAFLKQRCLVLADGFFEWKKEGKSKIPYLIRLKSEQPFAMAGLYNRWISPEGEEICTNTIITTESNDLIRPIHDRMPVILPQEKHADWLSNDIVDHSVLVKMLRPYPSDELEMYEVTSNVNSPAINTPENIQRLQ
ncbi:MAG TPA: SOS response-associated peptidase [Nitrospirota bacterium]|nr:SOS response-associated peptidase [Nitrospirota bacterium]